MWCYLFICFRDIKNTAREFPGSPVVRTLFFHGGGTQVAQVWSLVGELISRKLHGVAKKKYKQNKQTNKQKPLLYVK